MILAETALNLSRGLVIRHDHLAEFAEVPGVVAVGLLRADLAADGLAAAPP